MSKQSVIAGEYILQIEDNGHVDVVRIPRNAMATMINISKKIGFKYDIKWNTRYFGYELCKEFGDSWTATFDDITISRQKNNKIDIVQECRPVKKALQEICDKMGFEYDPKWNTQYFGFRVLKYLTENKEDADKVLNTPNMKKCADMASAIIECPQVPDVDKRDPDSWARVNENGKYGFKDEDGNLVIPCKYDYVSWRWENGFCAVKIGGKAGYIDSTGKVIVPIEFNDVSYFEKGNYFIVNQGDRRNPKIGVISSDGKMILPFEYDQSDNSWIDGKCVLKKDGYLYILADGGAIEKKLPYDAHGVFDDTTGLSLVKRDGKWGYVNKDLEEVVPCEMQYYVLSVECNPYMLESMPMDADTLKECFSFFKDEYKDDFKEYGISKSKKLSMDNVGDVFAISRGDMFREYRSERHSYIDEVETIALTPIEGENWWDEYRANEHDNDVLFSQEEVNIEYTDYPINDNCIETVYQRSSVACGFFYRLLVKDAESFDPSKLNIVNSGEDSEYWDTPDVFYKGESLKFLGDGFGDFEFEYNTARLFWDGEEIDLPENEYGHDEDYDW